jgi:hypothetical protein
MKVSSLVLSLCLFSLLGTDVLAGRYPRDFSGDAMQQFDSRLPSSPMTRFPSVLGVGYWPFIAYPPAPSVSVLNITIDLPEEPSPPQPPKPAAAAKFWIARCGSFVQVEVDKADILEEEQKDCTPEVSH